jgi:dethiobiotin synthetase
MAEGFFITGTDTGVGKTVVACALLRAWARRGLRCAGMKPVAAGIAPGATLNEDAAALVAAGNVAAPLALFNPYAFAPAIAPHLAAAEAGVAIVPERVRAAYAELAARADRIAVEGAGGALTPLDARHDMLDLARWLALPVLLVVGMRLGCLNHALLSAQAIRARGLGLCGWIACVIDPAMSRLEANIATLEARLPAERLATVAWGEPDSPRWAPGPAAFGLS